MHLLRFAGEPTGVLCTTDSYVYSVFGKGAKFIPGLPVLRRGCFLPS